MIARKESFFDRSSIRSFVFFFILCLPILAWLILVSLFYFTDIEYSSKLVSAIAAVSPLIAKDISLFGEVTPALLAGSVIALSPTTGKLKTWDQAPNLVALVVAIIIYALFIHLTLFFSTGRGVTILEYTWKDYTEPQKALLNIISNVKVSAAVIFASIIGLRLKDSGGGK